MVDQSQAVARTVTGFFQEVGAQIERYSFDEVVIALDLEPRHLNNASTLHGGVIATLADVAMAMAGTYVELASERRVAITLSMSLSFTGIVKAGTRIRAIGRCRSAGHKIFMSSCEVQDAQGNLIALGEGVFKRGALRAELP